ncbi:MAG: NIPSNAP family protein [Brevundimonas sp.]
MSAQRLFEMRTYYPTPGSMEALENRFRQHTMRLFARHGITSVGYWRTFGSDDLRLIYILAYPDLYSRERSWAQFRADPEWQTASAASEQDGALVARRESIYLNATDYSPLSLVRQTVSAPLAAPLA